MSNLNDYREMRILFREQFSKFADVNGINVRGEWAVSMPDFVPVLIKFDHEWVNRILTVQVSSENVAVDRFAFAIRKTGERFEKLELLLVFKNPLINIQTIFEIYKKWFVERVSDEEIEKLLDNLTAKIK